jgi:hypothetical protein
MPQFEKGMKRSPTAGRKPGTRNKKSLLVLEVLENNGIDIVQRIIEELPALKPVERVDALTKLLPYCFPKLTAIEVSGNLGDQGNDRPLKEVPLDAIEVAASSKP